MTDLFSKNYEPVTSTVQKSHQTFLEGYVKDQVYTNAPEIIQALKYNIRDAIGEIRLRCH